MDGLWNPASDSSLRNEVFGFTTYTLLAILGLLVMIFIVRLLTMRFAPKVLGTMIRSQAIKSKTVRDSDKALGTAAGVGLAYVFLSIMMESNTYASPTPAAVPSALSESRTVLLLMA